MKTLVHNGVLFPAPFESKGFSKINNVEISLLAEEMLWKFSPYFFNEKYNTNKTFIKNVWKDLKSQLPKELKNIDFPKDLEQTFLKMELVRANEKVAKSEYNKTHKLELEKEKLERKEKYEYCYIDGEKVEISNPMVEGSRWFISRGNMLGRWVSSVTPEDIDINASENIHCIDGHYWKSISFKQTDFIASYKINIGFGEVFIPKSILLSANSDKKQDDTREKYEHAIELSKKWNKIQRRILIDMESEDLLTRENACIVYIISTFGIRIGNEKGENDIRDKTYGASTLLAKHIYMMDNDLTLNFVGKDSVVFKGTKTCSIKFIIAFNKIVGLKKGDEPIFKKATSSTVSNYLKEISGLDFCSPKLFRTNIGSLTLAKELQKKEWSKEMTDKQFKNQYDECCLVVSKTLNHQKTVDKSKVESLNKSIKDKLKLEKSKLKKLEKETDEKLLKLKNTKSSYSAKYSGKELKEKCNEIDEKINNAKLKLEKAKSKFADLKKALEFKNESVESNIGTARNSYSNPKVVFSLCADVEKDPSLLYSKTQLTKFEWAKDVANDFWRKYPNV